MLSEPLLKQRLLVKLALFLTTAISQDVSAQSVIPLAMRGKDAPFQLTDLPLQSQLRQGIEVLPSPQRAKAMAWLHTFSFPESDLASLRIDNGGGVYYKDTLTPKPGSLPPKAASTFATTSLAVDAFHLHSRPSASNKVYLDFDGENITGTAWNENVDTYKAAPYDLDNDPISFNNDERSKIAEIWHRIAEDYAPFDIDVTTEKPENFGSHIGHVLFTRDMDTNGIYMPAKGSGGVAYVNVWGSSDYASHYSPALVYYNVLGSGYAPYMAEAGAHEFGHNLGLSHDGAVDSSKNPNCLNQNEYYCGLGSGAVSWAPIMGAGYYANVTEWSKGEYPSGNNNQDDIDIIKNKLEFRADDIKNSFFEASKLVVESNGKIVSTNPENDPSDSDQINKGIIETNNDIDTFWFEVGAGQLNIMVHPAWEAYYRSDLRGANLDIQASLYDQKGNLVVSDDSAEETFANVSATLDAGRYFLSITGVGNKVTPYSSYASLGQYFITGQVTPVAAKDTSPPSPSPMTWQTKPFAQDKNTIVMIANTAVDDTSPVQYQFRCLSGGKGCVNSYWQYSPIYVATGLASGTSYTFRVLARDQAGNKTGQSVIIRAKTMMD